MVLPKYLPFFKFIDLALLVTVFLSLQREPFQGMLTGFVAGLGGDIIAAGILGVGGFAKTLIGYLVAMASVKFPLENPLARLAVVAVASAANTVLYVGLHLMLEQYLDRTSTWAEFGKTVGWKALGDTVTAVFLFIVLNRVFYEQEQTRRMSIRKRFYE
jgi:rod shape-determining protein MreD